MEKVEFSRQVAFYASQGQGFNIIEEPEIRKMADYWSRRRGERSLPRRTDIDPIDIPWALSRIFLVDYEPDERTFRYRIAGDAIEQMFRPYTNGASIKGKTLHQILPRDVSRLVHERWLPMITDRSVLYMRGPVYQAENRKALGARIVLPLGDGSDDVIVGALGLTVCKWEFDSDPSSQMELSIYKIPIDEAP